MSNIGPTIGVTTPSYAGTTGAASGGGGGLTPATASVYADFVAGSYYVGGVSQASFAAFLTAAGGTYTNSTGKYVTNSSGVLTSVAANTAPFNYQWNGTTFALAGLLLEGAATNLLTNSNTLSTGWAPTGNTVTAGATTGPDGTASGWSWLPTATTGGGYLTSPVFSSASGTHYTVSAYVKTNGRQWFQFASNFDSGSAGYANFDIINGVLGTVSAFSNAAIAHLSNGWFRCSVEITAATTTSGAIYACMADSGTAGRNSSTVSVVTQGYYLFGFQLEAHPFPTSYIATTTAAVARSADSLHLAPAGGFAVTAETLFAQCTDYAAANTGTIGLAALNDGTASNRINLLLGTGTTGQALASSGGTAEFTLAPANAVAGGLNKCAVSANVGAGGIAVINAGTAATGAMAAMPVTLTTMDIGYTDAATANSLYGDLAKVAAWPFASTALQLQTLTT
jgi:hypothetical protein